MSIDVSKIPIHLIINESNIIRHSDGVYYYCNLMRLGIGNCIVSCIRELLDKCIHECSGPPAGLHRGEIPLNTHNILELTENLTSQMCMMGINPITIKQCKTVIMGAKFMNENGEIHDIMYSTSGVDKRRVGTPTNEFIKYAMYLDAIEITPYAEDQTDTYHKQTNTDMIMSPTLSPTLSPDALDTQIDARVANILKRMFI